MIIICGHGVEDKSQSPQGRAGTVSSHRVSKRASMGIEHCYSAAATRKSSRRSNYPRSLGGLTALARGPHRRRVATRVVVPAPHPQPSSIAVRRSQPPARRHQAFFPKHPRDPR
jgi:hypothetical protein